MSTAAAARAVPTFTGEVTGDGLGMTLVHEHVFVLHPELDVNLPHPEWDEERAVEEAVAGFEELYELGVRTVVDLTVPGLGRDVRRVRRVAEQTRVALVAATGWYSVDALPAFFQTHGPGRPAGGDDPLEALFVGDIRDGIAGTGIRAAIIKIASDAAGLTPDVARVFAAAATAHGETGVPITTHSHAPSRGGLAQLAELDRLGVASDHVVIGHAGDSTDLHYLRELAARGAWLGFDRFGMAHVQSDEARMRTLLTLLTEGLADRILLSHDAAFFSRVTPPSWRAAHAPHWRMDTIPRRVLPHLHAAGIDDATIRRLMVENPRRMLTGEAMSVPKRTDRGGH